MTHTHRRNARPSTCPRNTPSHGQLFLFNIVQGRGSRNETSVLARKCGTFDPADRLRIVGDTKSRRGASRGDGSSYFSSRSRPRRGKETPRDPPEGPGGTRDGSPAALNPPALAVSAAGKPREQAQSQSPAVLDSPAAGTARPGCARRLPECLVWPLSDNTENT